MKTFTTKKGGTWTYGDPLYRSYTYHGRPSHMFLGPCPECEDKTFNYGGGWRCIDWKCNYSAENSAPNFGPEPKWWTQEDPNDNEGKLMKTFTLEGKDNKLIAFMYILLRDKLTFGQIESIMKDHINELSNDTIVFEDENMAKYAIDLADRLTVK